VTRGYGQLNAAEKRAERAEDAAALTGHITQTPEGRSIICRCPIGTEHDIEAKS
jgi:hypothetical protein